MMELKNAVAICLISLFSATLVLLIARALDLQTASRLEPQLTQIAEELRAIRKGGGLPTNLGDPSAMDSLENGLTVYYFHSNTRCPTCRSIESQSLKTVNEEFRSQLENNEVVWKTVNYEKPSTAELVDKFQIQMPVVVVAQVKDGQIQDWKRLDEVWGLVGDEQAFAKYVKTEIEQMSTDDKTQPAESSASDSPAPSIPLPNLKDEPAANDPSTIPLPN